MTTYRGNARHYLDPANRYELPQAHALITSPPYPRQRRYGTSPDEIGTEETLDAYVAALVEVFDLARDHLHPGAAVWVNLGDKANGSGGAGGDWTNTNGGPGRYLDPAYPRRSYVDAPGAVLRGLLAAGWTLRAPIVWDKGREAPEDLRHVKRPRFAHEMIYLLTPGPEPLRFFPSMLIETGTVWHFPPGGNGDQHLAPFPDELARRCLLPSTLPGDTVLDPFMGSGTVAEVARRYGRHAYGFDLYTGEAPPPRRPGPSPEELAAVELTAGEYGLAVRALATNGRRGEALLERGRLTLSPIQRAFVANTSARPTP